MHLSEPSSGLSLLVGAKCPLLLESLGNRSKASGLSSYPPLVSACVGSHSIPTGKDSPATAKFRQNTAAGFS